MRKNVIVLMLMLFAVEGYAQNINDYKYVVVPLQFDFLKGKDQYRVNTLTRFLFKQENFNVYFDEEKLPEDLFKNRCLALYADVKKVKGGFFKTKLEIELKDCYGNLVLKSKVGSSKEKAYEKAYGLALREAFESFENLDYIYTPKKETDMTSVEKTVVKDKENAKTKTSTIIVSKTNTKPKNQELLKETKSQLYYAQKIDNGYQLVDAEPKVVMVLFNTAAEHVYLVKGKSAIVFKEEGFWYYSENNGKQPNKKQLNIKF